MHQLWYQILKPQRSPVSADQALFLCDSARVCCQYARTSPHTPRAGQGILPASVTTSKTPTMARTQQTGPARRLPDVNKHSSVLPSKGSSHCCGQRCLPCVMLDEMAGNVLAVLMYIGAFRDLLRGEGGVCSTTLLSLHRSKSRVKTIR